MSKRLAVFLDGTSDTEAGNTNVWQLKSLCSLHDQARVEQQIFYSQGLGAARDEKLRGGIFGYGIDDVVYAAYEWLIEHYEPDDEVFIFGFSRGAFTARSLAGLISRCGLIQLGAPMSVQQAYNRYKLGNRAKSIHELLEVTDKSNFSNEERWIVRYCLPIDVKFTGVWDTVAALSDTRYFSLVTGGDHEFLDANLRKTERFVYHALALDEHRQKFDATLFMDYVPKGHPYVSPRPISDVEKRWFCGSHGDVGGGALNDLPAQLPLQWLMAKAEQHGLAFRRPLVVDEGAALAPIDNSLEDKNILDDVLRTLQLNRPYYRSIDRSPEEKTITTVYTVNETIDGSVFNRWRNDTNYRPKNLSAWAKKHDLDPADLRTSVQANDPTKQVAG